MIANFFQLPFQNILIDLTVQTKTIQSLKAQVKNDIKKRHRSLERLHYALLGLT